MKTHSTQISIHNCTPSTLLLAAAESTGIDRNVWPQRIPHGRTLRTFTQTWNFQIKFTARYVDALSMEDWISFNFHAEPGEVIYIGAETAPQNIFSGSQAQCTSPGMVAFSIHGPEPMETTATT